MLRQKTAWALLALLALPFAAQLSAQGPPPPVVAGDLLGSTGARGLELIEIDPATGAGTTRFPAGSLGPVSELRFRSDGVLFGSTGGGSSSIITIDPDTGAETLVGVHDFGAVTALEFVDGVLYGAFFGAGMAGPEFPEGGAYMLVEINQADGSLTPIGTLTDYDPVRGLAYDTTTGTMYGVGFPIRMTATEPEGLSDELFTIDLGTAATTSIGPTSGIGIGGMAFGPDGLLYGGASEPLVEGGSIPLVTLNTATGAATEIGDTGAAAISGLAFVPNLGGGGGAGDPVVAIPTASGLGLTLLCALLAAAALFVLRRG